MVSGSTFEERIGYARAVVDGDRVHVSGTTGFDYASMTISEDVVEQARQCLRNIGAALAEAGCTFADVVRVRYLMPAREDFEPCWPVLRRAFGEVRPAATMMVCGLADERMRIEIEVDARRGPVGPGAGLRVEPVAGDAMVEEWRQVHNAVVPPAAMSWDRARERAGRYRLANAYLGDVLVGCSTVRPPEGEERVATVIARVLPAFRGRGSVPPCTRRAWPRRRRSGPGRWRPWCSPPTVTGCGSPGRAGSWRGTGTCWMVRATSGST